MSRGCFGFLEPRCAPDNGRLLGSDRNRNRLQPWWTAKQAIEEITDSRGGRFLDGLHSNSDAASRQGTPVAARGADGVPSRSLTTTQSLALIMQCLCHLCKGIANVVTSASEWRLIQKRWRNQPGSEAMTDPPYGKDSATLCLVHVVPGDFTPRVGPIGVCSIRVWVDQLRRAG
jgi:hypothetical protein